MAKQRISYVDPATIADPAMLEEFERCRREGTPRPESSAIRAQVPACFWSFANSWRDIFKNGVCDHSIKELCRVYVSRSINCEYCGNQRSIKAAYPHHGPAELAQAAQHRAPPGAGGNLGFHGARLRDARGAGCEQGLARLLGETKIGAPRRRESEERLKTTDCAASPARRAPRYRLTGMPSSCCARCR